jgi:hypothetical protein
VSTRNVVTEALARVPEIVSRGSIERFLEEIGADASSTAEEILVEDKATFGFDELDRLISIEAALEPSP